MTSNHPQKPEHESGDIRVMIIGDSISQGREGDWTWRYRIWEWFRQEGIHTTFVGPYKGTVPPDKPEPPRPPPLPTDPPGPPDGPRTTGGYAAGVSPDFLSNPDHYSTSGWQAAQAKDRVADQVAIHQPDICLVELGFNDLGWFVGGPDETLANIKAIVDRARVAKPNLKFAIADVPQRTAIPGRDELPYEIRTFNWLLARAIPIWSTDESPIGLAAFCDNYSCGDKTCKASYDGLHPNALGEYQLAQAFSRALIAPPFSFGQHELAIPPSGVIPLRPTPTPANFSAVATPAGVTVTWDSVYGAIGYELREEEGDDSWPAPLHLSVPRHDTTHCVPNQRWEYQVRTTGGRSHIGNCGRPLKSPWSKIASAVAHPETAPGPVNIQTHATEDGFSISWDAPPFPGPGAHHQANKYEIDRYGVIILDSDAPGSFPMIVGVPGDETSAEMRGLVKG
ncbi:SGNH hydrolase-type esterase domain-containing protein, partial [Bombardia bombarda]